MKKIIAMLLALVMVVGLVACTSSTPAAPAANNAESKTENAAPAETKTEEAAPAAAKNAADIPDTMTSADGKYEIAFVTDVGQLMDKSFNQGTWEGCKLYADANGKSYKYYQPANGENATDDDRYDAMKAAVEGGAKAVVCAGFMQGTALAKAAAEFPEVKLHLHRRLGV